MGDGSMSTKVTSNVILRELTREKWKCLLRACLLDPTRCRRWDVEGARNLHSHSLCALAGTERVSGAGALKGTVHLDGTRPDMEHDAGSQTAT